MKGLDSNGLAELPHSYLDSDVQAILHTTIMWSVLNHMNNKLNFIGLTLVTIFFKGLQGGGKKRGSKDNTFFEGSNNF